MWPGGDGDDAVLVPRKPAQRGSSVTVISPSPEIGAHERHVRMAMPADLAAMGWILAVAFHHDPVMTWAIPDEARRRATLPGTMELLAEYFQPLGANRVDQSGTGAAVWSPPGVTPGPEADAGLAAGLEVTC